MNISPNFAFLKSHDPQLVILGSLAEQYFANDPITCLMKLRQYGELLAQLTAAKMGFYTQPEMSQVELLNSLAAENIIFDKEKTLFHELRKLGNQANHQRQGNHGLALHGLKFSRQLGIWFYRTFQDKNFQPGPFVPPEAPQDESDQLKSELDKLRQELEEYQVKILDVEARAKEEEELRQIAEELLTVTEQEANTIKQRLLNLQTVNVNKSAQLIQATISQAEKASKLIDLDESDTRFLIDQQLQEAGWEADSEYLTYDLGVRPEAGRNLAIAEYPVKKGRADYVLFVGLQMVGIVEAKRQSRDVSGDLEQAKRYSRSLGRKQDQQFWCEGAPWGEDLDQDVNQYYVPFVFATNGRPFLQQLRTKSGIWFCDLRRPENIGRPLMGWYSPQALIDLLKQDIGRSHDLLKQASFFDYDIRLRAYQIQAIETIEEYLAKGQRHLLVGMATGTGKTKTALVLIYRLLTVKRFRQVLFIVDRNILGEQAENAFIETRMENLQSFANIFGVKRLIANKTDGNDAKVHIATIQGLVKKLKEGTLPPINYYDCVIVDECHRGYGLDQEMTDLEFFYRDFADYVSNYRRVLDYFDGVKIGLTATPALHTAEIFGEPVYTYSYREAVIDGWLIDHEPPITFQTLLKEKGISWQAGESRQVYNMRTGEVTTIAPDEVASFEVEQFNKYVITENFNRVICEKLTEYLDPYSWEKTLIFCATDDHADMVVDLLKLAFEKKYGSVDERAVMKITGKTDQPLQKIREFKNELYPNVAVTVDLLTTGVDVPAICNLVFLRRVNSRILYEQMLGRATRQCDDIQKKVFRIFDAVGLYEGMQEYSEMKPVVKKPNITVSQLLDELSNTNDPAVMDDVLDQLLVKLRRKEGDLIEDDLLAIQNTLNLPYSAMLAKIQYG
ncbi:MAG: type I restriction-modification system endonuclease, partial [Microcoleaceae cyanobacterium]